MSSRRGKKVNPAKNAGSARDFAAGKRIGRTKQVWVWKTFKTVSLPHTPLALGDKLMSGTVVGIDNAIVTLGVSGQWEKVNVQK
jgi:hypothetical protein